MKPDEIQLVKEYMRSQVIKEFWDIDHLEVVPNIKQIHNAPKFWVEIKTTHKQTKEKREFKTNAMKILRQLKQGLRRTMAQQKEEPSDT